METTDRPRRADRDALWSGVAYVLVGVASLWIFASGEGSAGAGGVAAGLLVVLYGLASLVAAVFSDRVASAGDRLTGGVWLLVGLGIAGLALAVPLARRVSGLVVGAGLALYGLLVALDA